MVWTSLVNALLGIWLIIAPAAIGYGGAAATNDLILGITVLCVAVLSMALLPRFTATSYLNLACGIWITMAPAWVGYSQLVNAASNDVLVGLTITVIAAIRVCTETPVRA